MRALREKIYHGDTVVSLSWSGYCAEKQRESYFSDKEMGFKYEKEQSGGRSFGKTSMSERRRSMKLIAITVAIITIMASIVSFFVLAA